MRILENRKIRRLFLWVLAAMAAFALLSAAAVLCLKPKAAAAFLALAALLTLCAVFAALWRYFLDQSRTLEKAIDTIQEYLAGNRDARIESDEEGELYRLFHEINSLAAVLNAQAENEGRSRAFLKETISDISHQLKTPLAALNIYNGLLQEEVREQPELLEFTQLSEGELDRIEGLVQKLLKMARLEAGAAVFEKVPQDMAGILRDIGKRLSCQAEREKKKLVLSGEEGLMLSCDRGWLTEALGNLVKNAFDHTGEGAEISISWRGFGSIVQVAVSDDGSGIHPEDLPHIFKRFYRSCHFADDTAAGPSAVSGSSAGTGADAPSLSQQSPGTEPIKNPVPDAQGIGLGLPLAKAVVEAHNGTIEADSEPGTGTVFTLNFLIPAKL